MENIEKDKDLKSKKTKLFLWLAVIILAVLFIGGFLKKQGFQFITQKDPFSISFGKLAKINLTIINDPACSYCNTDQLENALKETFKFIEINKFSNESKEGGKIIKEQKISVLPAIVFGKEVEKDKKGNEFISGQVLEKGEGGKYLLNKELLANASFFIREIQDKKLDLFIMSKCPFGIEASDAIIKYLKDNSDKGLNLSIHYILNLDNNGKITSLHGEEEVKEDFIQIIIQKYYSDKFFDYLLSRNSGKTFEEATKAIGINEDTINQIKEKSEKEGPELAKQEIFLTEELGIGASPTILWSNRYRLGGISELANISDFSGIEKYINDQSNTGNGASAGACQ